MKKLCTYLTLFVLGLLALAQPAAAVDFTKGTVYYIDASAWTGENITSIVVYDGNQNVTAKVVSGKIYSYTQSATKGGPVYVKRNGDQNKEVPVSARSNNEDNCIKINSSWNGYEWTTYTAPTFKPGTTYYANVGACDWFDNASCVLGVEYDGSIHTGFEVLETTDTSKSKIIAFTVDSAVSSVVFWRYKDENNKWDQVTVSAPTGENNCVVMNGSFSNPSWTTYTPAVVKPVVTADPASCTFYGSQSVTLSADKKGAKIYYTTDGTTEPSESNGEEYSAPLSFTETTTLKAVAILDGVSSEVLTATYTKGTPEVLIQPSSTTFETSLEVTITATPSDAKIYYTTDGTEPSTDGTSYDSPVKFTISSTTTVKAIAVINGVQSEKKEGVFKKTAQKLYIRGVFTGSNSTWGDNPDVEMPYNEDLGLYYYEPSSAGDFMISTTTGSSFWNGRHQNMAGSGKLTLPDSKPASQNIKTGGGYGQDLTLPALGTIYFDKNEMKIWYEPTQPVVTITPGTQSFDSSLSVTLSANPDCAIYYTRNGNTPDASSEHYTGPITISETTTLKAIAILNGVSSEVATATYTKNQAGVYTGKLYVKGPGHSDWTYKELTNENGVFSFEVASVHTTFDNQNGQFVISDDGTDSMEHIFHAEGQDTYFEIPVKANAAALVHPTTEHTATQNFYVPAAAANGKVFIDMNDHKIWYEPKQEELPTYLQVKGPAIGGWDTFADLTPTGNEGEFSFDATQNGEFVISTSQDKSEAAFDGAAYGPAPGSDPLIAASPASTPVVHSHTAGLNFSVPGAFKVVFNAKNMTICYIDNTRTDVFVKDKTYYIDCRNLSWFPGASAVVGIKWEGESTIHYGAEIVEVETDVYSFRAPRNMEYITIGRRTNDGKFYNERQVYVDTTKPGTNCIQVKEDNTSTSNVGYDWTNYISSSAAPLYILGQWLGASWGDNTPIAMNYEPSTGVFSYVVTAAADAKSPLYFSISKGSAKGTDNSDSFFNAANEFQYESHPYIRFSEPKKANAKNQHVDDHNFAIISAGTVKAKYDETDPTKLKVWYTPDDGHWPALYIIGANISDKDKDGQWKTPVEMTPSTTQPGIYSYVLDELYCDLDYTPSGADGNGITQNEKGHFNISFFPNYSSGDQQEDLNAFWKNSFIPDGGGMGMLSRDGVPFHFGFREEDAIRTNWTSTNFVFNEKCTIYVDAVRQLVWVKVKTELSSNQVVFDFWDKGGSKYTEADGYRWWNNKDNYFAQAYLRDAEGNETYPYLLNFVATESQKSDLNSSGPEQIFEAGNPDPVNVGQRYHFIASLPASYYQENGKVVEGKHIWIRIKKGASGDVSLERPYAYQATYTQGPKEDIAYNHYGNIKAAGDPIVTIEPSVNMIYADVEAPEHLGHFSESHVMHYPYVNQYSTAVTVNPGNVYPFWVEGLTEEAKDESGNVIADQYVPVAGAPFTFTKSNQVTVSYGSIRETKYGTTGMAVIKGIDHANATDDDKMEVRVTYTSPGLIFARTKTEPLKIDANELPTMQTSQDTPLEVAAFYSGTACNQGLTVDLILHQKFEFRDIMIQGGEADGKIYVPRAAYIGYEVNIDADKVNNHSHVAESHKHMAKNGVPLMWDFTDDHNRNIKGFTDLDKWHYEAFTGKRMAIQLHHVLCGQTEADLEGKTVTGTVTFHLYVPVATEFAFETGTTSLVRGMHKAGEQVNSSVQGDPNHPYTGSVSAKSCDTLTHNIDFSFAGNITTGVEGVGVEDAPVEFYNLQGVRMTSETLAPGIYIRRQGNETSKVYIR